MTNSNERCSDSVPRHVLVHISAVIAQFRDRDQIIQRRILFRFGGIFSSDQGQLFVCTYAQWLSPGVELGLADYAKNALHGEVVTTSRFGISRVALQLTQGIARSPDVSFERDRGLCPRQRLAARDLFRNGLIRCCGSLESSARFLRNNRKWRAAGENKAGHN